MIKKYIFVLLLFVAIFLVLPLNLNVTAKSQLPVSFNEFGLNQSLASFPTSFMKLSNLDFTEGISLDLTNINSFNLYEPNNTVEKSGSFRVKNSIFELNIFINRNDEQLQDWVFNNFSPYLYNEDQFSQEFSKNEKHQLGDDSYIMTNKVYGGYYITYFQKYKNRILALGLELGNFAKKDLPLIFHSIKLDNKVMDLPSSLLTETLKAKESEIVKFNQTKNLTSTSLSISINKLSADTSIYYLPWASGQSYMVFQDWGANDNPPCSDPKVCSHNTQSLSGYAYDFGMPEGTNVLASAAGTVAYIHANETGCGNYAFVNNANYVVIYHADGKATDYHHLKTVNVSVGQQIQRGEVIGQSGKTGYTNCAQHLHFQKQAQGAAYTQSEPFYFAEYPNVDQGEIVYGSYPVSQNVLGSSDCNGTNPTMSNWNLTTNTTCNPTVTLTILPESNLQPTGGNIITIIPH